MAEAKNATTINRLMSKRPSVLYLPKSTLFSRVKGHKGSPVLPRLLPSIVMGSLLRRAHFESLIAAEAKTCYDVPLTAKNALKCPSSLDGTGCSGLELESRQKQNGRANDALQRLAASLHLSFQWTRRGWIRWVARILRTMLMEGVVVAATNYY